LQTEALLGIATLYEAVNDNQNALKYLFSAQSITRRIGKKKRQVELHQRIGDISIKLNNYKQAYKEYSKALVLLEQDELKNEQNLLAYTLNQIGFLFRNLGQINESIDAYQKALVIYNKLGLPSNYAKSLTEIALSYQLMRKPDSALNYYSKALIQFQLQKDSLATIDILHNIGEVFFDKQQYLQAVASFNQSLQLATKASDTPAQVAALVSISRCHSALADFPLSTEYLNRALKLAQKQNLSSSAAEVYKYLSRIYETEGRFSQALEYHKLWSEIRDSLYIEEAGKSLTRIQILYDISQKERENEILRQNNEIQELQLYKARYQTIIFITLALMLAALLILFGFYLYAKQKEFKKQKETEQRIVELNKELEKRMILEIKKQEKQQLLLSQKSKLESLGTLAAGIAHEINQPLGGISMGLDNLMIKHSENQLTDTYFKEKVSLLFENVDRIKRIIEQVRTFSRAQKPASFDRVNINQVVSTALSLVQTQFVNHGIKFSVTLTENLPEIIGDKHKIEQVLLNLLGNAKHAVDEKEKTENSPAYEKHISIETGFNSQNIVLEVTDNGIGIAKKDIDKIFDPFYTTKKQDKGTGLGLSISYGIIKDILGDIKVESEEGKYTKFEVTIPIS
jgi:C4-dicarboxylate-specific signal transduction histidine kinase